nr:MAG TPA: hypothetical protein [Caudoviricetes sp.]
MNTWRYERDREVLFLCFFKPERSSYEFNIK